MTQTFYVISTNFEMGCMVTNVTIHTWQQEKLTKKTLSSSANGPLGSVHTELLVIALVMPKKWKPNIINGTIHTGLSEILSDSYACGKRQIFAEDFAKGRTPVAPGFANAFDVFIW